MRISSKKYFDKLVNNIVKHHQDTYVSSFCKYLFSVLNIIFWLFGGLLIGIGLYSFIDKWQLTAAVPLQTVYDVILNVSLVMVFIGAVIFVFSFAGCIAALRENTCLLGLYSKCILIFYFLELGIIFSAFFWPQRIQSIIEENFNDKIIHNYRNDLDLQNFIDFAQQEFRCCGLSSHGYKDWSKNEYFNCSSANGESCGVPFSCCINATDISSGLVNSMCGYDVQTLSIAEASTKVWTSGCINVVLSGIRRYTNILHEFIIGFMIIQFVVLYLAKTLQGQIDMQKSRYVPIGTSI